MNRLARFSRLSLTSLGVFLLLLGPSIVADDGPEHQVSSDFFGVSGGNVNDRSRAFCCGGTLGSLLTDGSFNYILSNNHVLARTDQATPGEDITQPGLIDNSCDPAEIVADFTTAPALGPSNVDAAIAQLRPGAMDESGAILDIGTPSSVVKSPSVGLGVAKSGRTTGFTTGGIGSINATVSVRYQRGCGSGRQFFVTFTNQVVIESSTFSAAGDSGSLIVTDDTCHQPVALLFAGSSTTTIGNPIGEVLTQVGEALGSPVSFVGTTCSSAKPPTMLGPSPQAVDYATEVMQRHLDDLTSLPSVIGVGVGASEANPSEAAIVVYVDATTGIRPPLPERLNGVSLRIVQTDPFIAY